MADLANHAAFDSAGYARIQVDYGSGASPRYISRYEKPMRGSSKASGNLFSAEVSSDVSQAAADTALVIAGNKQRAARYSLAVAAGVDGRGGTQTIDLS